MKKNKLIIVFIFVIFNLVSSQVGLGTNDPKASLDIRAKNHLGLATDEDGLLVPRVTTLEPLGSDIDKIGQKVYLIAPYNSYLHAGFYHWNGSQWISNIIEPWNKEGTTSYAWSNDQNIYHTGNIGIGTTNPTEKLDIIGTFKYKDGNQKSGKLLISDTQGNANWKYLKSSIIMGSLGSGLTNYVGYSRNNLYFHTYSSITLPANSKYLVKVVMRIPIGRTGGDPEDLPSYTSIYTNTNQGVWIRTTFTDLIPDNAAILNTNPNAISPDIISTNKIIAGYVPYPILFGILQGCVIIHNKTNAPKSYYYIGGNITVSGTWGGYDDQTLSKSFGGKNSDRTGENSIIGYPIE